MFKLFQNILKQNFNLKIDKKKIKSILILSFKLKIKKRKEKEDHVYLIISLKYKKKWIIKFNISLFIKIFFLKIYGLLIINLQI